jgi:transcriptional regulator with XRE-family HTH domain
MSIGEKIRLFAESKGISLAELANLLGMKPQSLQVYISGKSLPGSEILKKLKDLGCDINWLLSEDDKSPPGTDKLLEQRIKELEEENQRLRDSIGRISLLTQVIQETKKGKKRPKK